jgi:dihydrofolate reductase
VAEPTVAVPTVTARGEPGVALPRLLLIAAVADNGVIGRAQALPWRLPDDLQRFKALTLGKPILMGRRTCESIGRALPGRRNLVLTRQAAVAVPGVEVVASIAEALARCAGAPELCVIGGAELYRATMPQAAVLELTRVHAHIEGDVQFPPWEREQWREVARSEHPADARHGHAFSFLRYERC